MPSAQLTDYIAQQRRLGVSDEALRAALLNAGWGEAEVSEAMQPVQFTPAAASKVAPPVVSTPAVRPIQPAQSRLVQPAAASQPSAASSAFMSLDAFQSKSEKTVEMKRAEPKAEVVKLDLRETPKTKLHLNKSLILGIAAAVVIVALAGAAAYFYSRSGSGDALSMDKDAKILELQTRNSELANNVASITQTNTELTAKTSGFETENKDLSAHLSFFILPAGAKATTELSVALAGTLKFERGVYVLTTSRGLNASIKNSKDARVEAVLKPLVGSAITIAGTHLGTSKEITLTTVNNQPLPELPQASTSTPTSTTP